MPRVMLTVTEDERRALVELARAESRDPRAQGAMILRQALASAGYLPARQQPASTPAMNEVQR
jgi:hypothetical protein